MSRDVLELDAPVAKGAKAAEQRELDARVLSVLEQAIKSDEQRAGAAAQLVRECRHERHRILGTAREELTAHRHRERESRRRHGVWSDAQRIARQVDFVREAQSLGVDTDAIFALNEYERSKIELLTSDRTQGSGGPSFKPGPPGPPPPPGKSCAISKPPYNGAYYWSWHHLEGESQLLTSTSYFDKPTATAGGAVRVRNWDADDSDYSLAYQENGFVTWYKTNQIGAVTVDATFQRLSGTGTIQTENEWGVSDSWIYANSYVRCGVFHNDVSEVTVSQYGIHSIGYSGNGDGYPSPPGGLYGGGPFTVSFVSTSIFPANTWVGVYVGMREQVEFWVNDVSVDTTESGKYFISGIKVCEF